MKSVSFDFDNTLDRKDVQEYAQELINKGVDVWVTTSRFDEDNKHLYSANPTNEDMYQVTDRLNIIRDSIVFTNLEFKDVHLKDNFVFHLDDDYWEVRFINERYKGIAIDVTKTDWKAKCNKLLSL